MADAKQTEKEPTGNVVLAKFKKEAQKEDRGKNWRRVSEAVDAARTAYCGSWCSNNADEKLVSFEKAVGDLIEVLQKIKDGELKLGGLGDEKEGISILE